MVTSLWTAKGWNPSASALSIQAQAPSTGVSPDDIAFVVVGGVTPAPASIVLASPGATVHQIPSTTDAPNGVITETNVWWGAFWVTGLANDSILTLTVPSPTGKHMEMNVVAYPGSGVGNKSSVYARVPTQNTSVLPAYTMSAADSVSISLWAERNTLGATVLGVSSGAIDQQFRAASYPTAPNANVTVHTAISQSTPGSTAAPAITGTYTDGGATARASTNSGGIQVELLAVSLPPAASLNMNPIPSIATESEVEIQVDGTPGSEAVVTVAKNTGLTSGAITSDPVTLDALGLGKVTLEGLDPATRYFVGVSLDGTPQAERAEFPTAILGAHSFSFSAFSCALGVVNPTALDSMRTRTGPAGRPAEYNVQMGDDHYKERNTNNQTTYINDWREVRSRSRFKAHIAKVPWAHTPSDHDIAFDNVDSVSAGAGVMAAMNAAYARYWPTPAKPAANTTLGPWYSWSRGRVRNIMTDGRTFMSAIAATDNSDKTKLGLAQKAWFFDEIAAAKAAGQVVVWFSEDGGFTAVSAFSGDDTWAAYSTERAEILAYIHSIGMENSFYIIHGDFHALAADDGSHYGGIPSVCASPLSQTFYIPSQNQWSQGKYPTSSPGVTMHHYGWFDVVDPDPDAETLDIVFTGYSNDDTGGTGSDTSRITMTKTLSVPQIEPSRYPNSATLFSGSKKITPRFIEDGVVKTAQFIYVE